jgi:hypothetical protein
MPIGASFRVPHRCEPNLYLGPEPGDVVSDCAVDLLMRSMGPYHLAEQRIA